MSLHGKSEETQLRVTWEWHYVPASENDDCENMKM